MPTEDYQYRNWVSDIHAPLAAINTTGYQSASRDARAQTREACVEILAHLSKLKLSESQKLTRHLRYYKHVLEDTFEAALFDMGKVTVGEFAPFAEFMSETPLNAFKLADAANTLPPQPIAAWLADNATDSEALALRPLKRKKTKEEIQYLMERAPNSLEYWESGLGQRLYKALINIELDALPAPSLGQINAWQKAYKILTPNTETDESAAYVPPRTTLNALGFDNYRRQFIEAIQSTSDEYIGVKLSPTACVTDGLAWVMMIENVSANEAEQAREVMQALLFNAQMDISQHAYIWDEATIDSFLPAYRIEPDTAQHFDTSTIVTLHPARALRLPVCAQKMARLWSIYHAKTDKNILSFYTTILDLMPQKMPALMQSFEAQLAN